MKTYLIIQLARLGDLLQTKRLLLSLLQKGQVYLLVDKSLEEIARLLFPQVEVLSVLAHGHYQPKEVLSFNEQTFLLLKQIDFTGVYNLNYSPLNYACSKLFPGEIVYGYGHSNLQEVRSFWFQKGFAWVKNRKLAPLNLVDFWAYLTEPCSPIEVNPGAQDRDGPLGLVLGGRDHRRSLSIDKLARLIESFLQQEKTVFYLLGTKEQTPLALKLKKMIKPLYLECLKDLTGKTSLLDLPELLSGFKCLFTPDTGLMHLAAHVGTKVIAFFFSSAWCFETGPYGKGHVVFQVQLPCAPCLEKQRCLFDLACHQVFVPKFFYLLAKEQDQLADYGRVKKYVSVLDNLGVDYDPAGDFDLDLKPRLRLRKVLQQYLGGGDFGLEFPSFLFPETEWILANKRSDH